MAGRDTRLHTVTRETDVGRWDMVSRVPTQALGSALVGGYEGWCERSPVRMRLREVPHSGFVFILNLGPPFAVTGARAEPAAAHGSFIAGLHDEHVIVESSGQSECIEFILTPPAARRVLARPLTELTNRTVALADLFGPAAPVLEGRVREAPTWARRFEILERFLTDRLSRGPEPPREIAWAWSTLEQSCGAFAVGAIARELGWSRKRLVGGFAEHIGFPPKRFARVVRFQHAMRLIGRNGGAGWADLAARAGFADQAHLIREFRALAGLTPTELVRCRRADGGLAAD